MTKNDPIELEFFRQALGSVPEEMGAVLRKTAFSANIKERRDYSCAVYDARGATVAMGDHMPVHLGAMPLSVAHVLQHFQLKPGDVAIVNDPFSGGTHLPDITAVAGVFPKHNRPAAFFVAARAHHADVGGMSPGSMPLAREIYQEGLRLPPILLARGGRLDENLMRLILANVRTPVERRGDLVAQWMAIERGITRLKELTARYGLARIDKNVIELRAYAARLMRSAIAGLGEGRASFEDRLDEGAAVRVAVTLGGGRATVDFTGTDAQVDGPVNANLAITRSAVLYVFRALLSEDVPANDGLLDPIEIVAPEATLVNAVEPAAMAAGNVETSQRITDALLGALATLAPERIPAASQGTMNNVSFGGRGFAWYETIAGGMGASARSDGQSAVHTHMTNSWNTPVEAFEHNFPVRVRRYSVRRGSGGAGLHRGGDGIVREFEFLDPAELTILSDRRVTAPYGLAGGADGRTGRNTLLRGRRTRELAGKVRLDVEPGDVLRIETPGGGGFGRIQ